MLSERQSSHHHAPAVGRTATQHDALPGPDPASDVNATRRVRRPDVGAHPSDTHAANRPQARSHRDRPLRLARRSSDEVDGLRPGPDRRC
jgi:hypothetical protein